MNLLVVLHGRLKELDRSSLVISVGGALNDHFVAAENQGQRRRRRHHAGIDALDGRSHDHGARWSVM